MKNIPILMTIGIIIAGLLIGTYMVSPFAASIAIIILLSVLIGAYISMKGYLNFLVPILQPYLGKKIDNNLNLKNTITKATPKYRFNAKNQREFRIWKKRALPELFKILGIKEQEFTENRRSIPQVKIIKKEKVGKLTRYKLHLKGRHNVSIPCYMFVPNAKKPMPALLIPSGIGEGIIQTSGKISSYQNGNARFLAEKGFVTLTVENRGLGELKGIDYLRINANALMVGKTYLGICLEDQLLALDFLQSRKFVDKDRIGAAGVSLGGALSMYLALFDKRIKTAVVMGYLCRFKDAFTNGDHSSVNNIPNILNYFEMSDIASLIAPKKILYSNGRYDGFKSKEAGEAFTEIKKAYSVLKTTKNVSFIEHPGGHIFDNRIAYAFLKKQLM